MENSSLTPCRISVVRIRLPLLILLPTISLALASLETLFIATFGSPIPIHERQRISLRVKVIVGDRSGPPMDNTSHSIRTETAFRHFGPGKECQAKCGKY